jgi:uncharacterized protein (TIGR02246 family)
MKNIISAFVLSFFFSHAFTQNNETEAVKKIEQTRVHCFVTKDTATLNKIYASDVVFVNTLGATLGKKEVMTLLMDPERKYISADIDSITNVRIIGNTAILMVKTTLVRSLHDVHSTLQNSYMSVYEKRKGNWLLVAIHITLLKAK